MHDKHITFESRYSGYVGLQPYFADEPNKESNFLYQLKKQGLIDSMTVAFYVTLRDQGGKRESMIKFGSYDQFGLKDGSELQLLRTVNKRTWDLHASNF